MTGKESINKLLIPFLTNFLAVVLGIVITFAVQDRIDKKTEQEDIMAGLNLVRKELDSNITDMLYVQEDLKTISQSAKYYLAHLQDLDSCPADSVNIHWENISSESYLTLPDDALQMLKSTYLYSPRLDRELSLSIVQAYDICDALKRNFNNLEERKLATIEKIDDYFMLRVPYGSGEVSKQTWASSPQGKKLIRSVARNNGYWIDGGLHEIRKTIAEIDEYLAQHQAPSASASSPAPSANPAATAPAASTTNQ